MVLFLDQDMKNPFILLKNDVKNVLINSDSYENKVKTLNSLFSRNYSGKWLYSNNTEKFLGNGVAQEGKDCKNNPFYTFYINASLILANCNTSNSTKLSFISEEYAWLVATQRLEDWVK